MTPTKLRLTSYDVDWLKQNRISVEEEDKQPPDPPPSFGQDETGTSLTATIIVCLVFMAAGILFAHIRF